MDNQINLSCFSPLNVHLEILLTIKMLFLCLRDKDFTAKRHLNHELKVDVCTIMLKDTVAERAQSAAISENTCKLRNALQILTTHAN